MTTISQLTSELSASLRRPSSRTLRLLDKALSYLLPFESPKATVTSPTERRELLDLVVLHRTVLSPYLDTERVERHLRYGAPASQPAIVRP